MFPEFSEGTFLWQWFHSWAGVNAMVISLIVATLAVGLTKWSPYRGLIKLTITAGAVATLPLGLGKMGIDLTSGIDIPMDNDQLATYLNFFGSVLAVSVGVPYLFHHVVGAVSTKAVSYLSKTGLFSPPPASPAAPSQDNTSDLRTQYVAHSSQGPSLAMTVRRIEKPADSTPSTG